MPRPRKHVYNPNPMRSEVYKGQKFTYPLREDGKLQWRNWGFEANITPYLYDLDEGGEPGPEANKNKPKKPLHWWRAQCLFRGLPHDGALWTLQSRLRRNQVCSMIPDLIEVEKRLSIESAPKKQKKRDYNALYRRITEEFEEEERAEGLLKSTFEIEDAPEVIVFKRDFRCVPEVAYRLGLRCRLMNVPNYVWGSFEFQWAIVGKTDLAILNKIDELEREGREEKEAKQKADAAKEEAEAKEKTKTEQDAAAGALKASSRAGYWNVTGRYKVACPAIEQEYPDDTDGMELVVFRSTKRGVSQMYARFDFGIHTGWFRFQDQESNPLTPPRTPITRSAGGSRSAGAPRAGQKRKREYLESDHEGDADVESDTDSYEEEDMCTPDEDEYESESDCSDAEDNEHGGEKEAKKRKLPDPTFNIDPHSKPSASCPTWIYRWRGQETAGGEIQVGEDKRLYSVTFSGKGGTRISGIFGSRKLGKNVVFSGTKIQMLDQYMTIPYSINRKWRDRSDEAWERARIHRWW